MTLTQLRALLKAAGYKSNVEVDRFDVKRAASEVVGVDVMFTDGRVEYVPLTDAATDSQP
ncbi:hypothetical protein [Curtobacterium sp. DN_7.5]|uniref:hypothetical protein n=1 Tax=Curtobacterium sp. DN_7.5 TaxID=3049047 RepID=UPI001F5A503A|nr:hypothetical protein [Curtobacterium sp. DN_7.5]